MTMSQNNESVVIAVIGTLDNGEVFYLAEKENPMHVILGNNSLPPTLEEAISKMAIGDKQKVRVEPEEGYGPRQKDLVQTMDNPEMVQKLQPKPGMIVTLKTTKDGEEFDVPATVMEVNGTEVTIDYNHPLAGHQLTYTIERLAPEGI